MRVHLADNQTNETYRALTHISNAARPSRRVRWCVVATWMAAIALSVAPLSHADVDTDSAAFDANFKLPSITDRDQTVRLADYRGTTVYLDFWSSWCLPCRESLPLLGELQDEFAAQGFSVVTVNLDTFPGDGRKLMRELGIRYPVASDIGWRVAKQYGLETLPRGFLINAAGEVRLELPQLNRSSYSAVASLISAEITGNPASAGAE